MNINQSKFNEMKKLLVIFVFVFLGFGSSYAQGDLKLGFNAGLPIGDAGERYSLQVGGDVAYLVGLAGIVEVGPLLGYSQFFGEDDFQDVQFLPLAASGRLDLALLVVGLDLGYALGLQDGLNGGMYFRPKVAFGLGLLNLFASYSGISVDSGKYSSLNVGIELSL